MIPLVVDTLENLPEAIHEDYKQGSDGKYHLSVKGLRPDSDFSQLQSTMSAKEKEYQAKLGQYSVLGDRDPKEILSILDRVPELEAAAKGGNDEEKVNAMVEARIKSKIAPLEREFAAVQKLAAEREQALQEYSQKERMRTIHDSVRKAAIEAKVLPEATDDLIALASSQFDVSEDGKVVTKDGLDPSLWLKDIMPTKPYFWPASQGGGANGSRGNSSFTENPWSESGWDLLKQAQLMRSDMAKATAMAKRAGVTIGAIRPKSSK